MVDPPSTGRARPPSAPPRRVTGFEATAAQVAAVLNASQRGFALVGGFAVSIRTEPRFTQDLDLAVAVDDDSGAEQTVRAFLTSGYMLTATIEHEAAARLATARLGFPGTDQLVDLLFASSGIEAEIVSAADHIAALPGVVLPVATIGDLIALKLLARDDDARPQDAGDLRALRAAADEDDLARAAESVALITERGYDRGRDLGAALDDLLRPR